VRQLSAPAQFWLDGHYSTGAKAKVDADTLISVELSAILNSLIKNHVVLNDDARCFTDENGYPCINEYLKTVREHGNYHTEMSADIMRLTKKTNLL
jgi:hypothetical protein